MYGAIIVSMFDPKLVDSLNSMVESMPQMFALFGMNNFSSNLTDFLIDYLYSFLLIISPLVFVVLLVNRFLMKPNIVLSPYFQPSFRNRLTNLSSISGAAYFKSSDEKASASSSCRWLQK